jgi:hypothetical protein
MIQLLGPIANIASTWLQGKQEKAKAKQQLEVDHGKKKPWTHQTIAGKTKHGLYVLYH